MTLDFNYKMTSLTWSLPCTYAANGDFLCKPFAKRETFADNPVPKVTSKVLDMQITEIPVSKWGVCLRPYPINPDLPFNGGAHIRSGYIMIRNPVVYANETTIHGCEGPFTNLVFTGSRAENAYVMRRKDMVPRAGFQVVIGSNTLFSIVMFMRKPSEKKYTRIKADFCNIDKPCIVSMNDFVKLAADLPHLEAIAFNKIRHQEARTFFDPDSGSYVPFIFKDWNQISTPSAFVGHLKLASLNAGYSIGS